MNKTLLFLLVCILLSAKATSISPFGYDNENLPRVVSNEEEIVSTGGGGSGGNVTSVVSSTNCIFVSPTTGNVVLTFNQSCGGSGGGNVTFNVTSVSSADNSLIISPTVGDVLARINSTYLNNTIFNISSLFNDTTLINNVNISIWNYIANNNASWLSTFNATYDMWAYNQTNGALTQGQSVFLNLTGTNANQNLNIGIFNFTSSLFKGLFNWTTTSLSGYLLPSFNGANLVLNFNETLLNRTIDLRGNASNFVVLQVNLTTISSTTSETDFYIYDAPANTLDENFDGFHITSAGTFGGVIGTNQLFLYYDNATLIFDSGALGTTFNSWALESDIIRMNATRVKIITRMTLGDVSINSVRAVYNFSNVLSNTSSKIRLSSQSGFAGGVVGEMWKVKLEEAP